jgi:hypothetical protein
MVDCNELSEPVDHTNPSTYETRSVTPLRAYRASIGCPLSSNAGETSKAARIDATASQVDSSEIYCPGHLLKWNELLVSLCLNFDAPPPKSEYTNFAGVYLRDMIPSFQEAVWVEMVRIHVNPWVMEHCPKCPCDETEYRTLTTRAYQTLGTISEPFGNIYPL